MKNNSFKPLPPFKGWVLQNFPFIEEDFDAITSYQLWCKVVAYLNNTNNNVNVLAKEVLDIKNYFDNLDVQEEIDNKLDEMAESGELTDIIAQYLQLAGILAYNTLNDLKGAENLANGSFTKIYGKVTYNDGLGAFYKIRTLINTDVIDNDNLVALTNYPTLVAEKMIDATINSILSNIEDINTELTTINPVGLYKNKNLVVFGDSWSDPDIVNSEYEQWVKRVSSALGMNRFNFAKAGAGFARENNTFNQQLTTALSEMTTEEKNNTSLVIVFGGYNDIVNSVNELDIQNNCTSLLSGIKTNYPNAKIILAPFNWEQNGLSYTTNVQITTLINKIARDNSDIPVTVLKLVRYWIYGINSYYRNQSHPSVSGYNVIAGQFLNAILGGSEHVSIGDDITPDEGTNFSCNYIFEDGITELNYYTKFSDAKTNYSGKVFDLPSLAIPINPYVLPLYKANGDEVGHILIGNDGTATLKNVTIDANTYLFMPPISYHPNGNIHY